ncbi:ferredoxin-NADP reductase [Flammeovirga sp. MY04]|uniref:ferredoxin-NADP reductase n=1 Tax=Flammeovirga sp. MY04 TaxID=1191459 RepID=UPI0008062A8E|nr:ferredoxin-NADP reductase [Flammeovirga sp. MY04]ANQ52248.1 ferredoxin-NADP reductase [Flammeovirga sp. MY04]
MTHLSDYPTEKRYSAVVLKSDRLTPEDTEEVREILLEVDDYNFKIEVNQSFGVLVRANGDFGNTYHHRLYSVADIPREVAGKLQIKMLVKRCAYVDDFSGELFKGIVSNYICDLKPCDELLITGPFNLAFNVPEDNEANMILVGMGTGIAPFRAFINHIYTDIGDWQGKIRLFYGAKSGLDMLYMNDENNDLTQYYDQKSFEALQAVSPRPKWQDPINLDQVIEGRAYEIKQMLAMNNTHVYIAGYKDVMKKLDAAFANILGSPEKWETRKKELIAGGKWAEVIY